MFVIIKIYKRYASNKLVLLLNHASALHMEILLFLVDKIVLKRWVINGFLHQD